MEIQRNYRYPVRRHLIFIVSIHMSLFLGSALITITVGIFSLVVLYQIAKFRKKNMVFTHQHRVVKHMKFIPKFIMHGIFPSLRGVEAFRCSYRRTYDRF